MALKQLSPEPRARDEDRIDTEDEYARCAWARYFNTSEKRLKEAVAAVGHEAGRVRDHLAGKRVSPSSERPSGA
jgi:hypothetical protein